MRKNEAVGSPRCKEAEGMVTALNKYKANAHYVVDETDFCKGFGAGALWQREQAPSSSQGLSNFTNILKNQALRDRARGYMEEAMIRLNERNDVTEGSGEVAAWMALEAVIRAVNELVQEQHVR